jgi:signal transduction histidine kinase
MDAIGTLAGGIAHEFNNMLGIMLGNVELAADDIPQWNPAAECIEEIRTASLRARDVVRKLLSVAQKIRIKAFAMKPLVKVDLVKMVRNVLDKNTRIKGKDHV